MTNSRVLLIGLLTFSTMLVLSILFYKERTCFIDISYHLFSILKENSFAIQNNRFGAFFTQLFPLLGYRMDASLTAITVAYSVSFVILSFLTFIITFIGLRNRKVGITYLLFVMLMTTHTFYWIQSELPQAFSFLFILIAILDNSLNSDKGLHAYTWVSISILTFIICFTHPLLIIPFYFLLIYYYFTYSKKREIIYSVGLIYFSFYIFKYLFFKTQYDSEAMSGVKNFLTLFPDYINLRSNKNLIIYLLKDYYFVLILLIITLLTFFREGQIKKSMILSCFFVGYCLLVNVSYPNGADQFYLENQYQILAFLVAVPFTYDILPKIENRKIQYVFLSIVCVTGLLRIINTHSIYTDRLNWNRNLLSSTKNLPNKKLILASSSVPKDTLLLTWASSYELWLLSTLEQGESRSIIIEEKSNEFDWALPSNTSFISKWGTFNYSDLNRQYFVFNDSTGYVRIQ